MSALVWGCVTMTLCQGGVHGGGLVGAEHVLLPGQLRPGGGGVRHHLLQLGPQGHNAGIYT